MLGKSMVVIKSMKMSNEMSWYHNHDAKCYIRFQLCSALIWISGNIFLLAKRDAAGRKADVWVGERANGLAGGGVGWRAGCGRAGRWVGEDEDEEERR